MCDFFLGSSKVGGIPLAAIIHKYLIKESYVQAFLLLQKCLGNIAFYGQKYPLVFMTDDSCAERLSVKHYNKFSPNPHYYFVHFMYVKHFGDGYGTQNIK